MPLAGSIVSRADWAVGGGHADLRRQCAVLLRGARHMQQPKLRQAFGDRCANAARPLVAAWQHGVGMDSLLKRGFARVAR